jgi:hypothetical protein
MHTKTPPPKAPPVCPHPLAPSPLGEGEKIALSPGRGLGEGISGSYSIHVP